MRRSIYWIGAAVGFTGLVLTLVLPITAQPQNTPRALLERANLIGSGNTINASNIPVVTASGVVIYTNATLQFNVDSIGNLTLAPGFPQFASSPALLTSNFVAGTYTGPATVLSGKAAISIYGPGVTDGGATQCP